MKYKKLSNFSFEGEVKTDSKYKNFMAITLFTILYKKNRLLSIPLYFIITPLGTDEPYSESNDDIDDYYESIDDYIFIKNHFSYYLINNKKPFFMGISFGTDRKDKIPDFLAWGSTFWGEKFGSSSKSKDFISFFRKEIYNKLLFLAEEAQLDILAFLEKKYGLVEEITEDIDFFSHFLNQRVLYSVSKSGINFCNHVPSEIKINLEEHFSDEELLSLLKEIEELETIKNPFQEVTLEHSLVEYQKFLLTLFDSENCKELDLQEFNYSKEELICLHLSLYPFLRIELGTTKKYILNKGDQKYSKETVFKYLWYKLKTLMGG